MKSLLMFAAVSTLILLLPARFSPAAGEGNGALTLSVDVNQCVMDIEAQDVPLGDLLHAIGRTGKFTVESASELTEAITFSGRSKPLEEALRGLLAKYNYIMLYRKSARGEACPDGIRILGTNAYSNLTMITPTPIHIPVSSASNDVQVNPEDLSIQIKPDEEKKISRLWLDTELNDAEKFNREISVEVIGDGTIPEGVKIISLGKNTSLREIGIFEGDTIRDINGIPISSLEDLRQAIQWPPKDQSILMIKGLRDGKVLSSYTPLE